MTISLKARVYVFLEKQVARMIKCIDAVFSGISLGLMTERDMHGVCELSYDERDMYIDPRYVRQGFWKIEQHIYDHYLQGRKCIVVLGAGTGRELIELAKSGHEVTGYDCQSTFVEFANRLLEEDGYSARVKECERNQCPGDLAGADAALLGWGLYSLIIGTKDRIAFLEQLRDQLGRETPVMVSFLNDEVIGRRRHLMYAAGNVFRALSLRPRIELGDDLVPNYVHVFSHESFTEEVAEAGFSVEYIDGYSHSWALIRASD